MQGKSAVVRNIRTMPFCWIHKKLFTLGMSWKAIITYTALSYYSDGSDGQEIPIRRMAAIVGVSERTIMRGLEELENKNTVLIKKQFVDKNGKRQQLPNEYTLINLAPASNEPI